MSDFYTSRTVRAKKEHHCSLCRAVIPIGFSYVRAASVSWSEFFSYAHHLECSDEWIRQNKDRQTDEEWGWFDSPEDGIAKDWRENIKERYGLGIAKEAEEKDDKQ